MTRQRSVLITGASSGFGRAAAASFANRGWSVYATVRDLSKGPSLTSSFGDAGNLITLIELDLCSPVSITAAVEKVLESCNGRIDVLVNNAGIADSGFFEEQPEADFRRVIETNLLGTCALTRQVLPAMRKQRTGRIITVTSVAAYVAGPSVSAYVASKRALQGWMESLAIETRPFGISVAVVEPGTYKTNIWANAKRSVNSGSAYDPMRRRVENSVQRMVDKTGGDPVEVGEAIADIAEDRQPSFRNPVGRDARFLYRALGAVPFRMRARLIAWSMGVA